MSVVELFDAASPETRQLVTTLLEQDAADRDWAAQVGPSLTQADAARLLGKSEQATAKDPRLLRVKTRSGRVPIRWCSSTGARSWPVWGRCWPSSTTSRTR